MIEFKTKTQRNYVLALTEGEALHASLVEFARKEEIVSASVTAMGVVRRAVLDLPSKHGGRSEPIHIEGPLELSSFFGVVASEEAELKLEARAQLTRTSDLGLDSVGGRLLYAECEYLELLVTAYTDLGLRRDVDEGLGLPRLRGRRSQTIAHEESRDAPKPRALKREALSRSAKTSAREESVSRWGEAVERAAAMAEERAAEPKKATIEAPKAAAPVSFRDVAEIAQERSETTPSSKAGALPKRGDYIEHRVFGVCRVDQMQGDGVMVIRLETGRRKQLKVDALEFLPPETRGRRTIYPVRLKPAR